jgi:hypothetical protein
MSEVSSRIIIFVLNSSSNALAGLSGLCLPKDVKESNPKVETLARHVALVG